VPLLTFPPKLRPSTRTAFLFISAAPSGALAPRQALCPCTPKQPANPSAATAARAVDKPVSAAAVQDAAFEVIEADGTLAGAIIMISLQMVRQTRAEPGLRMVWVPASAISPLSTARERALKLRHRIVKAASCAARPAQDDGTDGMAAGVPPWRCAPKRHGLRAEGNGRASNPVPARL
jgi:hypothetical protein